MNFLMRHRSLLMRVGLSTALITFILTQIEMGRVMDILANVRLEFVALAVIIVSLERVLLAYKWRVLLASKGILVTFARLVKICYVTNFIGNFMPSSLGVDAFRVYSLYRHGTDLAESLSSVMADKVLSSFVAVALPVVVVVLFPDLLPESSLRWVVLGIAATLAVALVCLLNRRVVGVGVALAKKISRRIAAKALMLHESVRDYLGYGKVVGYVLLLTLAFQMLRVFSVYVLGGSMAPSFSFLHCLVFVPLIIIFMMIPVSVAGIGVREGGFVYFFSQAGVAASDAFALSVLMYLVGIIAILPGGIIYAMEGMSSGKHDDDRADTTLGKL